MIFQGVANIYQMDNRHFFMEVPININIHFIRLILAAPFKLIPAESLLLLPHFDMLRVIFYKYA